MYLAESGIKGCSTTGRPNRNWLSVHASRFSGSTFKSVKGLAFKVCSAKHSVVASTGNVRQLLLRIANIVFLQLCTSLSWNPPKCGAPGGLNFQMDCPRAGSNIASRSHSLEHSLNFQAAPSKFVPLSLMIVCSLLRLAMNLMIAIMHASASSPINISLWNALVTVFLNKQHQCFTNSIFKWTGIFYSCVFKGYTVPSTHSFGKLAMCGRIGCAVNFLHLTLLHLMLRNAFRTPITQNRRWTRRLLNSVPSWWLSSCLFLNSRTTAECFAEIRIGCFKSSLILALFNWSLKRIVLSLLTNGESIAKNWFTFSPLWPSNLLNNLAKV